MSASQGIDWASEIFLASSNVMIAVPFWRSGILKWDGFLQLE